MSSDPRDALDQADDVRLVIEASPNAMLMADADGTIRLVNAETERLFGFDRSELLGRSVDTLVPERLRGHHQQLRVGFHDHPAARSMGAGRDLFGLRRDGTEVPIEIGLSPVSVDGGLQVVASIIDITERKLAEQRVRETHDGELRRSILESLPMSVLVTDRDGVIVTANPAATRLLGYGAGELVGRPASLLHDPAELHELARVLSRRERRRLPADFGLVDVALEDTDVVEREWTYLAKDGHRIPVSVTLSPLHRADGSLDGFLMVAQDITERRRAERTIHDMALHDALTGLPNRANLNDRLTAAIADATLRGGQLAVLMIDLDQFKRVNDTFGHQGGDDLLVRAAHRIDSQLRDRDMAARLGGDEFVVLIDEAVPGPDTDARIEAITNAVAAPVTIAGHELRVTPSVGVAWFPDDGTDGNSLIQHADLAMYRVKSTGRNDVARFEPAMLQEVQDRLALESALRRALEAGEFEIILQPEVDLRERRTVGVEALLRWPRGYGGEVPPAEFVPVAEESGMILEIGAWVLHEACRQVAAVGERTGRRLSLAANVSPRQFQSPYLLETVRSALAGSGLPADRLEVEITEGMLMENPAVGAALLRELRSVGVRVAIDDFGTGYSSLSYLTRFPIDKIKIDQSFVRELTEEASERAVVDAIIALAHGLGMRVIAEGVETEAQERYLRDRGCDEAQGWRYAQGLPAEELVEFLLAEG